MKIDLCKLFGVEEGEEFKFADDDLKHCVYKVEDNVLKVKNLSFKRCREYLESTIHLNTAVTTEVIKLPKKKEFTDDELCILRNIDKEYKWIVRDNDNCLSISEGKPYKINRDDWYHVSLKPFMFENLFNSIHWEDEEPVYIDDYVERGVEQWYLGK